MSALVAAGVEGKEYPVLGPQVGHHEAEEGRGGEAGLVATKHSALVRPINLLNMNCVVVAWTYI